MARTTPLVSSSSNATPPERVSLSWPLMLGIPAGRAEDVSALLEGRADALHWRRPLWLILQLVAAGLVVLLRVRDLHIATLGPWITAELGVAVIVALGGLRRADSLRPRSAWNDTDMLGGFFFGICWSVALGLFTGVSGSPGSFSILATGGAMMVAASVLMAPSPIGGLGYILFTGAAAVTAMAASHGSTLAIVCGFFTLVASLALLVQTRALALGITIERSLSEKEEVISLLLREFEDTGADWLWRIDAAKRLTDVTPRLVRLFGLGRSQLEGRPLLALLAGEDWEGGEVAAAIRTLADRLRLRESFRDLIVPVVVAGEQRWWSLSAAPRRDVKGAMLGFWGVGTDVTERQRSDERIDRMARFDALTGLANRAHIIDYLGQTLRQTHQSGRRATLMLIDLDRFKQINDTLGHPVGDRLLIEVAGRLSALAGSGDVVGRLGGDEFALVVSDASDRDRVDRLAERICETLATPFEIDDHLLHIGGSVGSATAPRDGRVVETLLRNSDLALYRAKDDGRGVHRRYEPQLHAQAEQRRRIEIALRDALERGEMRLVYQPIVEASQGRLAGFETFLRWNSPELGTISPDVFIPIAEEARLIGRIGDWVMHTACRDAASWPDDIRVSVNMAPAQLRDPQLPATIVSALSHAGLSADRLELEIAEEVFVRDGAATAEVVDRILALGVRIALDDFGTGKSTLGYLRKGRFSTVKIDRSFVHGAAGNAAESIAIVRAIVAMADSLGMTTIAEGAETHGEFERMRGLGCRQIQGWMVGQPLDPVAARELAQGRAEERLVRAR